MKTTDMNRRSRREKSPAALKRRFLSLMLSFLMVFTNAVPFAGIKAYAAEQQDKWILNEDEVIFELDPQELLELAGEEAPKASDSDAAKNPAFPDHGELAGEYRKLFNGDVTQIYPSISNEGDAPVELQVFAKDGDHIIFLFVNESDSEYECAIDLAGYRTKTVLVQAWSEEADELPAVEEEKTVEAEASTEEVSDDNNVSDEEVNNETVEDEQTEDAESSDDNTSDEEVSDDAATDKVSSDDTVTDGTSADTTADGVFSDDSMVDGASSGDNTADDTDENASGEDSQAEDNQAEDNQAEDNQAEDNQAEDNQAEDNNAGEISISMNEVPRVTASAVQAMQEDETAEEPDEAIETEPEEIESYDDEIEAAVELEASRVYDTISLTDKTAAAALLISLDELKQPVTSPVLNYEQGEDSVTLENGMTITALWDTAVIPASAKLDVKEVTETVKDVVAREAASGGLTVTDVIAYDISLSDEEQVYSTWPEGAVTVTFSGAVMEEKSAQADEISVLHVSEEEKVSEVAKETVLGTETIGELSFEPGHFSVYALAFQSVNSAAVNTAMTVDEIRQVVADNSVIQFAEGTYSGLTLTIEGDKTFLPMGEVIMQNEGQNASGIAINGEKALLTIGGGEGTSFTISGYFDGIFLANNQSLTINILKDSALKLTGNPTMETNHGNGIWAQYNTELVINAGEGAVFIASDNGCAGINQLGGTSVADLNFEGCALVEMSRNQTSSGYHAGMDGAVSTDITFDGCAQVRMDENGWDAINFQRGKYARLNIFNCPDVTMTENSGWGINAGDIVIENSNLNISNNAKFDKTIYPAVGSTCSNLYCYSLKITDSTVKADNAYNANGIWVYYGAEITGSTVQANGNGVMNEGHDFGIANKIPAGGLGFYFNGPAVIRDSVITANGNTMSGMFLANQNDSANTSVIAGSHITLKDNGKAKSSPQTPKYRSGIVLLKGTVEMDNNVFAVDSNNRYGMSFYSDAHTDGKYVIKGMTVAYTDGPNGDIYGVKNPDKDTVQNVYVTGGSLQAERSEMTEAQYRFNGTAPAEGTYVAPVNTDETMLTRFDLNQEKNREAGKDTNTFTYYDPNTGTSYEYTFRYNRTGEDQAEGESGNAYVWAPVSVLHYDATQGTVQNLGTAVTGSPELFNTRGDQTPVGNGKDEGRMSARYAADYTIYGNSMNLSEGVMPDAAREGYKFLGWYAADDEALAEKYAAGGNWEALYSLLNTPFTASSKVVKRADDASSAQAEKTVYAKWALPGTYTITVNYLYKEDNSQISAPYTSGAITENGAYDISAQINKALEGYIWDSYQGVQTQEMSGIMTQDLVFNVYYSRRSSGSTSSGGSGGSSGSRPGGSGGNPSGGPGVTINPSEVPLASAPEDKKDEFAVINEEEVPLANLPKTGDAYGTASIAWLFSAMALAAYGILGKKREEKDLFK